MNKYIIHSVNFLALFCFLELSRAQAFTHPCIPTTLEELDTIKANLDKEPWKSGYAALARDSRSQLNYTPNGPWEEVGRTPDINLNYWKNDMTAIYNLARMWYFTGKEAYAKKARDLLIAWAAKHKRFTGQEIPLSIGDFAQAYAGGASILRGTWPGWTAADTATVKNYFLTVHWPRSLCDGHVTGPANKGYIYQAAGIAIAAFCDDEDKFNHVIDIYRANPAAGLLNTLATGQMGETGRDAGHLYGGLISAAFLSEVAWKQGIDLYSEADNRLLACAEYYARNTLKSDNPFVPYGTIDWLYYANADGPYTANRAAFYLIQNAYKNRQSIPTPWIDQKMKEQGVDGGNFMYARTADFSTATQLPAVVRPPVSPASSGLTLTTLGTETTGRSSSYARGTWTVTGLGKGVWNDRTDDCQFVYKTMNGNCAMVAQVTSSQFPGRQAKAGLMIRDTLTRTFKKRAWVGISPKPDDIRLESHLRGWTDVWGGSNRDDISRSHSPGIPYWLKIERRGDMLNTYTSKNGTSWAVGLSGYYADLPATLHIGLFVNSGSTTTNTVTFKNVAFTGGRGGLVTTPEAPDALFATGSYKAVSLRWLPSYGASAYDILRSTTSGSGYRVIARDLPADKTSYVDSTVKPGITYYYSARAKNSAGSSNNSPEFYATLLSPPLANVATSGTATDDLKPAAQTNNSAAAFDQNPGSLWFHSGVTGWLQYDFGPGNAQVVKRYTVNSAYFIPERDPKNWQFLASNDGTNWVHLDKQADQVFAIRMQPKTYDISNTASYRYYRFKVTANNGHSEFLHIGDIGLWSDTGRTIPDGTYVLVNRKSHKVMHVNGKITGSPVVQQDFTGNDSQQWEIKWQGNGKYRLTHPASSKMLDNKASPSTGADVVIQPSKSDNSQLWSIKPASDGFFHIESANSGLSLGVSKSSTANGTKIVQENYTGSNRQLWMPGFAVKPQPVPAVPNDLMAAPASIYQIKLKWSASTDAVSYNIKRATASGGPYNTVASGVNTTNYMDTGLNAGTAYYYAVAAMNGSGESSDSMQSSAKTLAKAPNKPTNLTTMPGHNQVTLNWAKAGGVTVYTVKRSTASGGPYTTITSGLKDPSYTDKNLTNNVTYYYITVANNAYGSSPGSAEIAATPSTLFTHLKFDQKDRSNAIDSSGRASNAILFNTPAYIGGKIGNALNFTATANQHAKLPSGIVNDLNDFTISTWIKVNSFSKWQRIFDFGTAKDNYMFLSTQGPAGSGRPRFAIRTSSSREQFVDSSITFKADIWTHIAVTHSGNTVALYINGALAGSGTITLNPSDLGVTTMNYLGKSQWPDPYLNAALDDFRIYSEAFSASKIAKLAKAPSSR